MTKMRIAARLSGYQGEVRQTGTRRPYVLLYAHLHSSANVV